MSASPNNAFMLSAPAAAWICARVSEFPSVTTAPMRLVLISSLRIVVLLVCGIVPVSTVAAAPEPPPASVRSFEVELPGQEHNAIKNSWPGIFTWGLDDETLKPGGDATFLDQHAKHSGIGLVTLTIRAPVEVTQPAIRARIAELTAHAKALGIGIALDLDVRLARQAFMDKHPGELQEIARLREVALTGAAEVTCAIEPFSCGDHYTYRARPYESVRGRVLRVYSFVKGARGVEAVQDITARCRTVLASEKGVTVAIPPEAQEKGRTACVMAAFSLFTPDVFAPHLLEFQRDILKHYAAIPLAGACKDEWGFPGRFGPNTDDLWFSDAMAGEYAKGHAGRELARDFLLMTRGEAGRDAERAAAINRYMELFWQRNGAIETDFYLATKEVFGRQAVVATHPTWFPMPNREEVFKDGLHWWIARRDLAQTDEATPFSVRTALAKKWHSPLWYNMYYNPTADAYPRDLYRHALGGGRMNFHPVYPTNDKSATLLAGNLFRADARVRLLNYVSTAPVDCPVAIVFGHPAALNWTGPGFANAGVELTNALWQEGHYADLIPSSEIANGSLTLAEDGRVQYGPQRYAAVIFFQPQYERAAVAEFFRNAAAKGKSALFRVGDWTLDFDGQSFDGAAALPPTMSAASPTDAVRSVIAHLKTTGIAPQTPGSMHTAAGFPPSVMPHASGQCRLLDGTLIFASGEKDVMGDAISKTISVRDQPATFDAIGIAAVRLDPDGKLRALAAGGLKHFDGGGLTIDLAERADVALWRDATGEWRGVLQEFDGPLPEPLARITKNWTRVKTPAPFAK